jgi:hypothetical protein
MVAAVAIGNKEYPTKWEEAVAMVAAVAPSTTSKQSDASSLTKVSISPFIR